MKTEKLLTTIAIIMVVLFTGCRKDDFKGNPGECPIVVSTDPINGATGVHLDKIITATFNEKMNPLTITQASFTVQGAAAIAVPVTNTDNLKNGSGTDSKKSSYSETATTVEGAVTYTDKTATIDPSSALLPNTTYTGKITTAVMSLTGNALQQDYIWTFTTGSLPAVISTDPANLATNVVLNKIVTATFSVPMDPLTIPTSFTLKIGATAVPGTVTYTGSTASFTPSSDLLQATNYTATITTGAKNVAGISLPNDHVWTFNTGSTPSVISTDPANLATGVLLDKVVTASFSAAMDPLTITGTSFTLKNGATSVPGSVSYLGTTASFDPTAALLPGTLYTATITTGAKNAPGMPMAADYVWTFTTGALPAVISTDPLNLAIGVAINKTVTASFSIAMDPLTISGTSFTLKEGLNSVAGSVSYLGTTASFDPTVNLLPGTTYTATITTGAKSVPGIPLASDYVWTFTTSSTPPSVILTDPLNLATGVALNKTVTADFSEAMDALTITSSTFTLKNGAVSVPGSVSYVGTTASFDPTSNLLSGTTYTATITTGAENVAGIPLASNFVWTFTTVAPLGPLAPALGGAAMMGASGGTAGVTNQGLNTVINNGGISTTGASTLITGFHDALTGDIYTETPLNVGNVTGGIFTAPPFPGTATSFAIADQARLDAIDAYNFISPASMPGGSDPGAGELGGLTLFPGIYKSAGATFGITLGDLTLDAQGDVNAVWVFQTAAGLTVGIAGPTGARSVNLINGAQAKNVFWYVGSAATINGAGGGVMVGTIIANSGVTFSTAGNAVQTVLNGRAISLISSVTMVNTTINVPLP